MRIGSLFSGVGGLDLAVEAVFGGRTVWHCEQDQAASKVLAYRWPGVPNLGDITAVDWSQVEPADVLCGGYPCQPFSAAGRRKGTSDDRHLWPYFAEAIRCLRPRFVVLENVAGHRSMGFDSVLGDLASMRFDAQWCSVRASDVGAPHRRERLFVLAADTEGARRGIWDTTHVRTPDREVDASGHDSHTSSTLPGEVRLLPTPRTTDAHGAGAHGTGGQDLRTTVTTAAWGKYAPAIHHWEQLTRPAPAPTEMNKNGNPRLSAAFAEWLMGWPAGWATDPAIGISRNDQLRCIGNGVVPQQAIAALQWLLSIEAVAS